jgi:protein TonB
MAASPAVTPRPSSAAAAVVVWPSSDADYLNNPAPVYPGMSRRMGEQGTVVLRVFINTEGRAEKSEIRTSSGYSRLDDAALATVQRWRYVPGKRAGVPEAMWFNVPIRFLLD